MDIRTGEIKEFNEEKSLRDALEDERMIRVNRDDMTEKQQREMKVSLKDHRSKLGKVLTKNRKRKLKRKGLLR